MRSSDAHSLNAQADAFPYVSVDATPKAASGRCAEWGQLPPASDVDTYSQAATCKWCGEAFIQLTVRPAFQEE